MNDKIFEIQEKWDKGCETGDFDTGDLFRQLLDIAYKLDNELNKVKNNVVLANVSSCLIKHIRTTVKIQRELWDNCDKKNTAQERKLNGKYMAYKELADGLRNNFFNNC